MPVLVILYVLRSLFVFFFGQQQLRNNQQPDTRYTVVHSVSFCQWRIQRIVWGTSDMRRRAEMCTRMGTERESDSHETPTAISNAVELLMGMETVVGKIQW